MYSVRKSTSWFDPHSSAPYRLSRSRIERFMECPRCFWLCERHGVDRPGMPAFSLNNAVDALLKKEFDTHRVGGTLHPLLKKHGLKLVPLRHARMEEWRDSFRRGIEYHHEASNFSFRGGVDDIWTDEKGTLYVVDYKATATDKEISLDDEWKQGYKRQVEMYQWLFRQNGFTVSDTAYFVFVNGKSDREAFDGKLEFDVMLVPYEGDDSWVESTLIEAKACLMSEKIPEAGKRCEYCPYRQAAGQKLAEVSARLGTAKEKPSIKSTRAKKTYEEKTASLF